MGMLQKPIHSYSQPPRRPVLQATEVAPTTKRYTKRWLVLIVLCGCLFFTVNARIHGEHVKALALNAAQAQLAKQKKVQHLTSVVDTILAADSGVTFDVSIIDPTGVMQNFGQQSVFEAGSTAKVLTAISYLQLVERHKATIDQTIGNTSARNALEHMIIQSDDVAWLSLNDIIGHPQLAKDALSYGIHDYDVTDNLLSANDLSMLMEKLYAQQLLNRGDTNLLLGWLKQANYRNYIVPAVPKHDIVYHKVGLVDDTVNDTAVISNGLRSIVITIFTDGNGTYDWQDRATTIQQITAAVETAYL